MAMTINTRSFTELCTTLTHCFRTHSKLVQTEKWQGRSTAGKPDMATRELLNVVSAVQLDRLFENLNEPRPPSSFDLAHWQRDIQPHLPWADNHFAERVGGEPLNPGKTYQDWRHGASAATFLEGERKQFNHTYMERMWPKHAGCTIGGVLGGGFDEMTRASNRGIRQDYGDLMDVVRLLVIEPHTRQAYLPLFFPEDTGIGDGGRKPCTLGYQFIVRDNKLHCYYPMRSCDFANHFRDDCYLAVRLMIWVIEQCRELEHAQEPDEVVREIHGTRSFWNNVQLGSLTLHATSLHLFINDFNRLCRSE